MTKQIKISGSTKSGSLKWFAHTGDLKERILSHFSDSDIELIVRKKKTKRSIAQNRWLWGVAYKIIAAYFRDWNPDQVFDADKVHLICKDKFLPVVFNGETEEIIDHRGIIITVPYSTTKLSTEQFQQYKLLLQAWAAELDIYIPDPNEPFGSRLVNINDRA